MKTIGIIGGMSAESTVLYYQIINREINHRLGGNHSAKIILDSLDFEDIRQLQQQGNWAGAAEVLANSAKKLQQASADCVLIATNTMHIIADAVQNAVSIPLLHIVDSTAAAIKQHGLQRIALLGTQFTMQKNGFYTTKMQEAGIDMYLPDEAQQAKINNIIFNELCLNQHNESSRCHLIDTIAELKTQGAQGVILGCTELCLLINDTNSPLPVFDSTRIHALAAVNFALH
ncbi:aspartate/glutamate racemase family protein [Stenoxybacter acetivorans]|uniref:aspartate/glutamate racemase family protein n=1 Tax=Stenoxybacter acetivorans TaxID=422441 RepID=UPI00056698CC|nr:aspartate/glutamate racemase family protein [Stenoxybacter acetivorans]